MGKIEAPRRLTHCFSAKEIAKRGAVISALSMLASQGRRHFPRRNRLIAALPSSLLPVEAPLKSGAMITMQIAERQGKRCFALPARAGLDGFRGNHLLIEKDKALLVENGAEVLSLLGPGAPTLTQTENPYLPCWRGKERAALPLFH